MMGWRKRIGAVLRMTCLPAFLALPGCAGVLDPQGPIGAADKQILIDSLIIMLVIVVPTAVATIGFAWWYRSSNPKARYLPDFAYSGRVELLVWSVPVLVILFLGGITWIGSHELDPAEPIKSSRTGQKPVEVQVVSLDWKWLFIYPQQGVASVNRLVLPVGTPVHFSLTSASVMNSFFVPQLGSMIYTMNGMVTQLNLQADKPGIYHGLSAHFSGDGFSDMHFDAVAVPAAGFADWISHARASQSILNGPAYQALARQSVNMAPMTYRSVESNLFDQVAMQKIEQGPGPDAGAPNPQTSPRTEH